MKQKLNRFFLLIFLFFPVLLFADVAVLIHGYHKNGNSWRSSGITQALSTSGWNDVYFSRHAINPLEKHIVVIELPSKAPMEVQSDYLYQYLTDIVKQYPGQNIHLIAHSAGGIVARLTLVKYYHNIINKNGINKNTHEVIPIVQLITIATPHMGSPVAEWAHTAASDTPIGFFAPFFGFDEINDAETLYQQLSRENKSNFLYWLNRQIHPPINYTSIVRADGSLMTGDVYVPPRSQDMAFVPALRQQSRLILTPGNHKLKLSDGMILRALLP